METIKESKWVEPLYAAKSEVKNAMTQMHEEIKYK